MNFSNSFLTQQIIAYIGNKRKLLPMIFHAMQKTGLDLKPGLKFLDIFAGSGVVSRLAKSLNFEVFCNDWEYYSKVINKGYLETNKSDIYDLFGTEDTFGNLIKEINSLPDPSGNDQYIAKYYAPSSFNIDDADFRKERLFYTRNNALAIDKIRNFIEKNFPLETDNKGSSITRNILIANLLYEAATHTNTSGVFKACHKGFGGHNKDSLKRIVGPIQLHKPVLIDSDFPVHIFQEDANTLIKSGIIKDIDIAYLDPPYNQHQYGSNYHLLNTIAKWDRIPAPLELNSKGELKEKAAIRHDWINTRSEYCYRQNAENVFSDLLTRLDAKYILISYSTDGIIPFETMRDICMQKGKLSIVTNEYTKYRGGKQSNNRLNTNIEFILSIDTTQKSDILSVNMTDNVLVRKKILLLFKQKFSAEKLRKIATKVNGTQLVIQIENKKIILQTDNLYKLFPPQNIDNFTTNELKKLHDILSPCICKNKEEELGEILSKVTSSDINMNTEFVKLIPDTLKKLANKKNKQAFYYWLNAVKAIDNGQPELYSLIQLRIEAIERLAEIRFNT